MSTLRTESSRMPALPIRPAAWAAPVPSATALTVAATLITATFLNFTLCPSVIGFCVVGRCAVVQWCLGFPNRRTHLRKPLRTLGLMVFSGEPVIQNGRTAARRHPPNDGFGYL